MNKLTALLISLTVLLLVGCDEEQMTARIGTAQRTDLNVGVGVLDAKATTEIGVEVEYDRSDVIDPSYRPNRIGPYITFWLSQDVSIEDTPEPSPIKDLLESLHAQPYAGINLLGIPEDGWRDIQPNYRGGSLFRVGEESPWAVYTEYVDGDTVDPGMRIGIMATF